MWMLWPPYRRRVLAEAEEYLESFGDRAYSQCRTDCIEAMERRDKIISAGLFSATCGAF